MTNQEFSDSFDTLLNSYAHKIAFGDQVSMADVALDEYEKSLWLTKAQEQLIISLYSGRNAFGASFEETEELRRYLAPLIVEDNPNPILNSSNNNIGIGNSRFYQLKDDVWFITYEALTVTGINDCDGSTTLDVVPVTQDEYHKIKRNPFRGANGRRALRLDLADNIVEIVCIKKDSLEVESYYIRYLRKPNPIILVDLTAEGLEIGEKSEYSECELPEVLHQTLLEGAVGMALRSKGITLDKN